MANITKVPNGPLIKKKGQFKGSTLKAGGVIKKAVSGNANVGNIGTGIVTATPEQRAQALVRRAEIKRKNDSILDRNAAARGMTREQVQAKQQSDKNKPDAGIPGMEGKCSKPGGSCGAATSLQKSLNKGKNGLMLKRKDGSSSRKGLYDNIRANKGSGKKPTKQMLVQEKKIKAKSKK